MATAKEDALQYIQHLKQLVQQSGVPPQYFIQLGQLAERAIKDHAQYPLLVKQLQKLKILDPGEFDNQYSGLLIQLVVLMGKIAEGKV
jgi:hypothetical protein